MNSETTYTFTRSEVEFKFRMAFIITTMKMGMSKRESKEEVEKILDDAISLFLDEK